MSRESGCISVQSGEDPGRRVARETDAVLDRMSPTYVLYSCVQTINLTAKYVMNFIIQSASDDVMENIFRMLLKYMEYAGYWGQLKTQ